jgi:hypothetical protein
MNAANAVVQLQAVVQPGGGVSKEDFVGAMESQCPAWLLLSEVVTVASDPVIHNG